KQAGAGGNSIGGQRGAGVVVLQDLLVGPAVVGVAHRAPLAHADAVAVAVHVKDEAVAAGIVGDGKALAAQAAAVHALAGQQRFAEPAAAAGGVGAAVGADLHLADPAVLVGGQNLEPAVGVHAAQVNAQHIQDALLQGGAGKPGSAGGGAVGVPVGGSALVVGAFHRLQPGAVVAPHVRRRRGAGGGRRKVGGKADVAVIGDQ